VDSFDPESELAFYTSTIYARGARALAELAGRSRSAADPAEAERAIERAAALGARLGGRIRDWRGAPPPRTAAHLAQVEAELSRMRDERDPEPWRQLARRWTELGYALDAAYSWMRAAEALMLAGAARAKAEEPLRAAIAAARGAGAIRLVAEIEGLARRARLSLGSVDAEGDREPELADDPARAALASRGLTDREVEVLELVSQGMTNRQIGEALFISEKTASVHVSHILGKLEVRRRVEAATLAHELGLAGNRPPPG
jgi:DNA-binding CsgD family transcriptional regulator